MLYGDFVKLFNDATSVAKVFVNDYFRGINSLNYVDAYKSIDKTYIENVLEDAFDFENMVLSKVVPENNNEKEI